MTTNFNSDTNQPLRERLDINFVLKAARLGVWELDPVTKIVSWDERCRALFGLASNNLLSYEQAIRHIHPDDREGVDLAVQQALSPHSGGNYDITHRTIGADDGLLRWVRFMGQSYFNETGEVLRFAGVAQDVTGDILIQQRLNTSKLVEDSEHHIQHLIDSIPGIIWETRPDGYCTYLNKQWYDITGQTVTSAEGFGWLDAIHPDDAAEAGQAFMDANQKQVPFSALYRLRQQDGTYRWSIDRGSPRFDVNRVYEGMIGTVTDVHDQKMAEETLKSSGLLFRNVANSSPTGLWLSDQTGSVTYLNSTLVEWTGMPYESLLGAGWANAIIDEDRQHSAEAFLTAVATRQHYDVLFRIRKSEGSICWCQAAGDPYYDDDGHYAGYAGFCMDVDELVKQRQKIEASEQRYRSLSAALDEQVQQRTQQLQSMVHDLRRSNDNLQQFAYVASHDLQEPLRKIQSFSDILKHQYREQLGANGADFVNRMQTSANRMSTLIKDLLTYSRISTQQDSSAPVSLGNVLDSVLNDLDLSIQETNAVVRVDPLPLVQGDKSQLGQLFQNLLNNALKFRKPDQTPRISITCQAIAAPNLPPSVKPTREAKTYYRIDVADNGIGFDQKYVDRIFQVFQRLHGRTQYAGTGIGLAICEKVAANHGGSITAHSKPGEGATFSVYLPN